MGPNHEKKLKKKNKDYASSIRVNDDHDGHTHRVRMQLDFNPAVILSDPTARELYERLKEARQQPAEDEFADYEQLQHITTVNMIGMIFI